MTIELAVKHYGSQQRMAAALRVSPSQVSQWVSAGHMSPAKALMVEAHTKGWIRALSLVHPDSVGNDSVVKVGQ